jgi:hypothetical protein
MAGWRRSNGLESLRSEVALVAYSAQVAFGDIGQRVTTVIGGSDQAGIDQGAHETVRLDKITIRETLPGALSSIRQSQL